MRIKLPVSEPDITLLEKQYINEALDSGWISSSGKFVDKFQQEWAQACGTTHSLAVANGTVALHLILASLGVGEGDEVIVPSLTFIASANSIKYVGAIPRFCDVDRKTWCLDVEEVRKLVNKRTKAVMAVHLYGNLSDILELKELCKSSGIYLIEDAAEAPFGTVDSKPAGSIGEVAAFSFYGNKIISSGEGGSVVTSNLALYDKMKLLRDQGMDPKRRYFFKEIGFNYRLTNLQCALLCAQLERSKVMLDRRRAIFKIYDDYLGGSNFVEKQFVRENVISSPWLYTVLIKGAIFEKRDLIAQKLLEYGIETRPIFIPIHTLPPYFDAQSEELPNTVEIASRGISIPTSSVMTDTEAHFVAEKFLETCHQVLE